MFEMKVKICFYIGVEKISNINALISITLKLSRKRKTNKQISKFFSQVPTCLLGSK